MKNAAHDADNLAFVLSRTQPNATHFWILGAVLVNSNHSHDRHPFPDCRVVFGVFLESSPVFYLCLCILNKSFTQSCSKLLERSHGEERIRVLQ